MTLTISEFAGRLSDLLEKSTRDNSPGIYEQRLQEHFGTDPTKLPIVKASYGLYQHPCIHKAIDLYLSDTNRSAEILGTGMAFYKPFIPELLDYRKSNLPSNGGPVQYISIELANGHKISCIEQGLYLLKDGGNRLAMNILRHDRDRIISIEILAEEREKAEQFLTVLQAMTDSQNVYRGHVLSLKGDSYNFDFTFHKLAAVPPESLIFPDSLMQRIEQQTYYFYKNRDALRSAKLPLKRGILLYGVPGTGKTLTIKYLLSKLEQRTTMLICGQGMSHIKEVCQFARSLQPSTIIIEDVDLVAECRERTGSNPLLMDLLNEMDGLSDDTDVLFLLTTNRPEVLEPALASRPGRIDQAIKIPLPDDDCRHRLFEIYGKGLLLEFDNMKKFVDKTKGASAAFIRELVRKAALLAVNGDHQICVKDCHFDSAFQEMLEGGNLAKAALGFQA